MAPSWNVETVTRSFAGVRIAGANILDLEDAPMGWAAARQPVMYPNLEALIMGFNYTRQSQGAGGTALMDMRYTLPYRFVYGPIGSERTAGQLARKARAVLVRIINAMLAEDDAVGLIDIESIDIERLGVIDDPSGASCYGCDIAITVMQFES